VLQASVVPTLRKVREGWGTPCVVRFGKVKSLGHPPILDPGQQTAAFETADFNGDGRVDLAIGLYLSNEVAMFFNQGGGIFTLSYFAAGLSSYEMRTGDFNGNGKLDLVMEQYPPENPPVTVNVIFHK